MSNPFFDQPILNSPYIAPTRHWELDASGQPTQKLIDSRRRAQFVSPIPKPKKRQGTGDQTAMGFDDAGVSSIDQEYATTETINRLRDLVTAWRANPNPNNWGVTPETARLLQHWRQHKFNDTRPFFCQVEAVETVIWLTEVAPKEAKGRHFLDHLQKASAQFNPGLLRLGLKLATGAGKTTVMAMVIAWQTVNAVRKPGSNRYSRGFLVVTPGLTIKDRLRVIVPNDPNAYYAKRELVPVDMLPDLGKAKVVITNYHAFKLRERLELSKGGRSFLQGRGEELSTVESEGQMLQRVMPELMAMKNVLVLNDEAHHCYREKLEDPEDEPLTGDERKEAEENREAARLWISGLETVQAKLGISRVIDLSATPFFLSGSGYAEGTLFPWTLSDFSLMDAIECGIVKLPRVPIADNLPGSEMPMYRELWKHIGKLMPKRPKKDEALDPRSLPAPLLTALDALYGHYRGTFEKWREAGVQVPPCFIIVCNNTATSKLVYDYISGFAWKEPSGKERFIPGQFELFQNHDQNLDPLAKPRTLLIDSRQLESGEGLDEQFRKAAGPEIEAFKREILERGGAAAAELQGGKELDDVLILREVMNTVGKRGRLGEQIRCVVSVSMLTEGWDANTVTHVLGVRAFGTQLLCEQVIGRALRRQSYDLNEEGRFNAEYADVLGIPFDFTAKPVPSKPQPPRETINVRAVHPERNAHEIRFPRVTGYRVELPEDRLTPDFTDDSKFVLTPDDVGATITLNSGIIGEQADLTLEHMKDARFSQVVYDLTAYLLVHKWRPDGETANFHLFGQMKRIVHEWLTNHFEAVGGTNVSQLRYRALADRAAEKITHAIVRGTSGTKPITVLVDSYNPVGSTSEVNFNTSKTERWETSASRCHLNWVILDSDWEAEFCRVAEKHPKVRSYVKNHNLGFEVPYVLDGETRRYRPDFIVLVDDGHGDDDLLRLVVEIKGYRGEDAKAKKETIEGRWIPGVNHAGRYGRWAFAEFQSVYEIESEFAKKVEQEFERVVNAAVERAK